MAAAATAAAGFVSASFRTKDQLSFDNLPKTKKTAGDGGSSSSSGGWTQLDGC